MCVVKIKHFPVRKVHVHVTIYDFICIFKSRYQSPHALFADCIMFAHIQFKTLNTSVSCIGYVHVSDEMHFYNAFQQCIVDSLE